MLALQGKSRLAIDFDRFPAKKWKNQTVQYKISINHSEETDLHQLHQKLQQYPLHTQKEPFHFGAIPNESNIQGVPEKNFLSECFSRTYILSLIWAILGILDNSGHFGQFWAILGFYGQFWANLGNLGNFGQILKESFFLGRPVLATS